MTAEVVSEEMPRMHARKNMFLGALLQMSAGACPVKVRNMSRSGAMIESPVLPPENTPVVLVRGSLHAKGLVAWRSEKQCGIKFSGAIDVERWLAPSSNSGQDEIDRMVEELRRAPSRSVDAVINTSISQRGTEGSAAITTALLEMIADSLADDPSVLARHSAALQALDVAIQLLRSTSGPSDQMTNARVLELTAVCAHHLEELRSQTNLIQNGLASVRSKRFR